MPEATIPAALRPSLQRLGDRGLRAERFLDSAAAHLTHSATEQLGAQHACYATREALTSILELGGERPPGVGEAAELVVDRYNAGADSDRVLAAVRRLQLTLEGPGPHDIRLARLQADLAGHPPTRADADLIVRFVKVYREANAGTHGREPADPQRTAALLSDVLEILGDLFGPISERLTTMDALAAVNNPGPRASR